MTTKYLRDAWKMSRGEIAAVLGCSKHTIAQHERTDGKARKLPPHSAAWLDELGNCEPPTGANLVMRMRGAIEDGHVEFWRWQFGRELAESFERAEFVEESARPDPNQLELGDSIAEQKAKTGTSVFGESTPEYMEGREAAMAGKSWQESMPRFSEADGAKGDHWMQGWASGNQLCKDLDKAGMLGRGETGKADQADELEAELGTDELTMGSRMIREGQKFFSRGPANFYDDDQEEPAAKLCAGCGTALTADELGRCNPCLTSGAAANADMLRLLEVERSALEERLGQRIAQSARVITERQLERVEREIRAAGGE